MRYGSERRVRTDDGRLNEEAASMQLVEHPQLSRFAVKSCCRRQQLHDITFQRGEHMRDLLKILRGSRIIAQGWDKGRKVTHYLLADGWRVLEVVE